MFQGGQAEQTLSEDNYSWLVRIVLGEGLQKGIYTEDDKVAYIKAWSQPGALTGGLNYYRANRVGPPSPDGTAARGNFAIDPARLTVSVPTLVILGRDRHSAAGPKPGRTRTICAAPGHPAHSGREPLGGARKAGRSERVHPGICRQAITSGRLREWSPAGPRRSLPRPSGWSAIGKLRFFRLRLSPRTPSLKKVWNDVP